MANSSEFRVEPIGSQLQYVDRSEDRSEASCQQQKASGSLLHLTLSPLHRRPATCRRMHLASPEVLRLTERASQELWRQSILIQNTHHLTHNICDTSSESTSRASVDAEKQAVGVVRQWASTAGKNSPLQLQRQIRILVRANLIGTFALPCAKHGCLPLPGQDGALPGRFRCVAAGRLGRVAAA